MKDERQVLIDEMLKLDKTRYECLSIVALKTEIKMRLRNAIEKKERILKQTDRRKMISALLEEQREVYDDDTESAIEVAMQVADREYTAMSDKQIKEQYADMQQHLRDDETTN